MELRSMVSTVVQKNRMGFFHTELGTQPDSTSCLQTGPSTQQSQTFGIVARGDVTTLRDLFVNVQWSGTGPHCQLGRAFFRTCTRAHGAQFLQLAVSRSRLHPAHFARVHLRNRQVQLSISLEPRIPASLASENPLEQRTFNRLRFTVLTQRPLITRVVAVFSGTSVTASCL